MGGYRARSDGYREDSYPTRGESSGYQPDRDYPSYQSESYQPEYSPGYPEESFDRRDSVPDWRETRDIRDRMDSVPDWRNQPDSDQYQDRYQSSDRYPSSDRYQSADQYPSSDRYQSADQYPSLDKSQVAPDCAGYYLTSLWIFAIIALVAAVLAVLWRFCGQKIRFHLCFFNSEPEVWRPEVYVNEQERASYDPLMPKQMSFQTDFRVREA